jgi:hypothetical protein
LGRFFFKIDLTISQSGMLANTAVVMICVLARVVQ